MKKSLKVSAISSFFSSIKSFSTSVALIELELLSEKMVWYISKLICYRQPSYDQGCYSKAAYRLSVRLQIKLLGVQIPLLSPRLQIWHLLQKRSSLTFRQTMECRFTLKLVRDMIITDGHCGYRYRSQRKTIFRTLRNSDQTKWINVISRNREI